MPTPTTCTCIVSLAWGVTVVVKRAKWKPLKSPLPPLAKTVNPNQCFTTGETVKTQKNLKNIGTVVLSYSHVTHQCGPCKTQTDPGGFMQMQPSGSPDLSCNARCGIFTRADYRASSTWNGATDQENVFLSIPTRKENQKQLVFILNHCIYLLY